MNRTALKSREFVMLSALVTRGRNPGSINVAVPVHFAFDARAITAGAHFPRLTLS
jgi:hypothetical protein